MKGADAAWRELMQKIISEGEYVAPRGMETKEILHTNNITVDMRRPVVTSKERRLSYKFMAAEALWMVHGRNDLESLTKFVPRMSDFSDNGQILAGAYGPRISGQIGYVVGCLAKDLDTRQAALTIWTPNPEPSKDIPCTVAMTFSVRKGRLYQHAFMRSSDAWLGIPYDIFSFTMVGLYVLTLLNYKLPGYDIRPGALTISMTSSHIYMRNVDDAIKILNSPKSPEVAPISTKALTWYRIEDSLRVVRDGLDENVYWDIRCRE